MNLQLKATPSWKQPEDDSKKQKHVSVSCKFIQYFTKSCVTTLFYYIP